MTERELNISLREMARSAGLCDEWYGEWSDDDTIDMCLDRYVRGFDFAVKNDYPSIDFIRKNFSRDDLHRHNIYIDEDIQISDAENGYYVFLGKCSGDLWVNGFKAVTVFVRHGSRINVGSFDGARVQVRYYDGSDGVCKSDDYSKVMKIRK